MTVRCPLNPLNPLNIRYSPPPTAISTLSTLPSSLLHCSSSTKSWIHVYQPRPLCGGFLLAFSSPTIVNSDTWLMYVYSLNIVLHVHNSEFLSWDFQWLLYLWEPEFVDFWRKKSWKLCRNISWQFLIDLLTVVETYTHSCSFPSSSTFSICSSSK